MRYSTLFSLLLLVFIDSMGFGLIFPILSPLMFSSQGMLSQNASSFMRDLDYTLILGSFAVSMFFATPFIGDLSDRYGRKPLLVYNLLGTAISSFICAYGIYEVSIFWLLIGRIGAGLTAGCGAVSQAAMVDISDEKAKTRNFGLMSLAGSVGFAMGPVIGGYFSNPKLVWWFSYWTPFVLDGLLALLNAFLLYFTYHQAEFKPTLSSKLTIWKPVTLIYEAFQDHAILRLSAVLIFYEMAWSLYLQYISMYLLQHYHLDAVQLGNFMTFIALILAVTFVVVIRVFLKWMVESTIIMVSLPVAAISIFGHTLLHNVYSLYWIAVPLSIAVGLIWTTILTLFSNAVVEERQGWSMGVANSVISIAWILGSVFTGLLDYVNPQSPFWLGSLMMLASFILMIGVKRREGS